MQFTRQRNIGNETAVAAQESRILDAADRRADALI
jgi:hypothetical protein